MDLHIKNKNVLVTASSMGIGKSAAELFIKEGCNVTISSSSKKNLENAAADISKKYNIEPFAVLCDLNKPNEIENLYKSAADKFGRIDILVNNCGGPKPGFFDAMDDQSWMQGYEQVLMSVVRMCRLVLPSMKLNKWGRIINVTSLSVKQPVDNLILSNSFRSGVTAFAKTISNQYGADNITVNNVAPGYTLTARLQELAEVRGKHAGKTPDEILTGMAADVPLKRLASPEEVASMILFLASEQGGYITGQTIAVDGGLIRSTY